MTTLKIMTWLIISFLYLMVNECVEPSPTSIKLPALNTSENVFLHSYAPDIEIADSDYKSSDIVRKNNEIIVPTKVANKDKSTRIPDVNSSQVRSINSIVSRLRPGQYVRSYALDLTTNGNKFSGIAVIDVMLSVESREDAIILQAEDLDILSVRVGIFSIENSFEADFSLEDGLLMIEPYIIASHFYIVIEYTGSLTSVGRGFYRGKFQNVDYLAMNLHPTHARRVFPCMDEPTQASVISFTFNGLEYNHVVTNTLRDDSNIPNQFRALHGPPHRWAMAAHNLTNISVPATGVFLYIRPGIRNQEIQASVALNYFYNNLVEWTEKPYFEIDHNQADQLSILSLPDVSMDWYGLSTIAIWEPHVLMENRCSTKQKYTALQKMSQAMARQWFGQVIYPENWRYEWLVAGLASYAGFDVLREYQSEVTGIDISLLDVNTLFVTEVIQESLYRDSYSSALTLELMDDLFEEDKIRDYLADIHKVKAPALFRMLRLILSDKEQDFIQLAIRALVSSPLNAINYNNFVDAIQYSQFWDQDHSSGLIEDVYDFLNPYLQNNGCPLIHVAVRFGGVLVTQERFAFSPLPHIVYNLPLTYTTNINPDYENIYAITMMESTWILNVFLNDEASENYIIFNLQGQGYYRVNYDYELWRRIIKALDDPKRREEIHPLNRATLLDDALNLARGERLDYGTALIVVLTMEHETEYAPWRAFIRNMNFLRKRLTAYVLNNKDLDPDIYLRILRRIIVTFEREIGFIPDPQVTEPAMTSLTRGLVMDHACRAGYEECIAAAFSWFYDPNSKENVVNPNIPSDIRPAVYCTMVREGGDDAINALYARLDVEVSMWERVVILESLTCSTDTAFVRAYLMRTLAMDSPYSTEEKVKIFIATAESSYENARVAFNFIKERTDEIRNMYGGAERLEELIHALTENMADVYLSYDFFLWVYGFNNLRDSVFSAERLAAVVGQNSQWDTRRMDYVYEWIDKNIP